MEWLWEGKEPHDVVMRVDNFEVGPSPSPMYVHIVLFFRLFINRGMCFGIRQQGGSSQWWHFYDFEVLGGPLLWPNLQNTGTASNCSYSVTVRESETVIRRVGAELWICSNYIYMTNAHTRDSIGISNDIDKEAALCYSYRTPYIYYRHFYLNSSKCSKFSQESEP